MPECKHCGVSLCAMALDTCCECCPKQAECRAELEAEGDCGCDCEECSNCDNEGTDIGIAPETIDKAYELRDWLSECNLADMREAFARAASKREVAAKLQEASGDTAKVIYMLAYFGVVLLEHLPEQSESATTAAPDRTLN